MQKKVLALLLALYACSMVDAQVVIFEGKAFELSNVKASVVDFYGENVLKVERDLDRLSFDANRLGATVDEPTYVKLKDVALGDGMIEVKVLSRIQRPSPFEFAQGFIGIAFRIQEDDAAFESIYLRPKVGRSDQQASRNKTVQYFSYPDYKFDRLRKEASGRYETTAPIGLNEWITMRIEVRGEKVSLYLNDARYSTFVVDKMLGQTTSGSIGLWVDIGTEGYFKDLKVTQLPNPVFDLVQDWERAKNLTRAYLDAMPAAGYALKPSPEMPSFAEQMLHLAAVNYDFAAAATGIRNPFAPGALEATPDQSKAHVTAQVLEGYDFVIRQIKQLTPTQLPETVDFLGRFKPSRANILTRCFEHQTHQRGQAAVYLRLAGVELPEEQGF